jgi:antitoxin component HigA of HigAB toxin-antitoxin module
MSQVFLAHSTTDDRPTQVRIATIIKGLMAMRGEDQEDLAGVLFINQSAVSKMLRGTRKMTVDELALIAAHYDLEPAVFFRDPEELFRSR